MWFGEWMHGYGLDNGCDLGNGWMDVVWRMDGWMDGVDLV